MYIFSTMMHRGGPGQRPYDFIFALYPRHVAYGDVIDRRSSSASF